MSSVQTKPYRNQSIECCRLAASFFVLFIHVPFPGNLGELCTCLARFAVPFFFAVSGYFSFQISPDKIRRQIRHLLRLHLIAVVIAVAVTCFLVSFSDWSVGAYLRWESWPDKQELCRWLLIQVNPYGGHLWYLTALLVCYLLFWAYTRFFLAGGGKIIYRPLYQAGFSLFCVFLAMSNMTLMEDVVIPYKAYRNAWFMGIPMFSMGLFLREYGHQIIERFSLTSLRLLLVMAAGIFLSLLQSFGGYPSEMPLGMLLFVPALMLFLIQRPVVVRREGIGRWISLRFGVLSTAVYLLHVYVRDVYNELLLDRFTAILGTKEDTLRPLIVLGMTLILSAVWERIDWLLSRKK